jgi:putative nucleotidyltransferase with HDIG domain
MRKFFIDLSNRHELILKWLLFILVVLATVWMLPHGIRYKFDYSLNKAWAYPDLKAPFDFAIEKQKDSVEIEKRQRLQYAPYFLQKDSSAENNALLLLTQKVNSLYPDSSGSNNEMQKSKSHFEKIIHLVYQQGVIQSSAWKDYADDNPLKLVTGAVYKDVSKNNFIDSQNVKEKIKDVAAKLKAEIIEDEIQLMSESIQPDIFPDKVLNDNFRNHLVEDISLTKGIAQKGDVIISRGEVVTPMKMRMLESLKNVSENYSQPNRHVIIGQMLLAAVCMMVLMIFLAQHRKDIYAENRKITLLFLLILFSVFIYTWILKSNVASLYVVPLCILPVVVRTFFDTRLALFCYVTVILLLGSVAPNGFEFVFTQIIAGMVAIFSIKNMRKRSQAFFAASMIFIAYMICYTALEIIHEGNLANINWENSGWLLGNVLLTLFAYPMIYFLEKLFGLTSDISLVELADSNNALLRELSIKVPGTFQHSLQVANLAEAAIFKIGGNSLLVRAGALYHDIGKMEMPLYFIENQSTQVNPHDELAFDESAGIIISHVIKGIEKARKNKLPDLVIDFIRTHHGTTRVQYFYESFLKNFPDKMVDEEMFHYPGPKPFSKETAILMMADSVEAASRSLKTHDAESIRNLVDKIIDNQIEQEQFLNCNITFRDISEIKKLFKKMLGSIYHVRVEYLR